MATGFIQRFKGKIKASTILGDFASLTKGLFDSATGNAMRPIWTNAGAPTSGGSGTLAGYALPGDLLIDTTDKSLYQNTGTQATPTWTGAPLTGVASLTSGAISGVTLDASVIGGSTPAAVTGTTITATGYFVGSAVDNLTAHSGGGQTSALALTHQFNRVTTVAAGADSVRLPVSAAGMRITVINDAAANALQVFGAGTDTIDGIVTGTGVAVSAAKRADFVCITAGAWQSLEGVKAT